MPQLIHYQGRITVGGTNFTGTGSFRFALVDGGTNTARRATATATVNSGFITSFTVTDGGSGYASAPAVQITDPAGSGSVGLAWIGDGVVTNISVVTPGSGYATTMGLSLPRQGPTGSGSTTGCG